MALNRPNVTILVILIFISTIIFFTSNTKTGTQAINTSTELVKTTIQSSPRAKARNSTLGFQRILAVSSGASWRTRGLEAAGKAAGISIEIPQVPLSSQVSIDAFRTIGGSDGSKHPSQGSTRAWLAHLDIIKYAISARLHTAFIVEDDADWDVNVREQMGLFSASVRAYQNTPRKDLTPYGTNWDVLWLGHCGDVSYKETPRYEYPDKSLIEQKLYAGWSKKWLANVEEGYRAVHESKHTVCASGYGLSARGMNNTLMVLSRGADESFDVALSHACRDGMLTCITVNPEIMSKYKPADKTGYVTPIVEEDSHGTTYSSHESNFEKLRGVTPNLKNSARCEALFKSTCLHPPTTGINDHVN